VYKIAAARVFAVLRACTRWRSGCSSA